MADASVVLKLLDQLSPGLSAVNRAAEQTGKSFDTLVGKVSALREKNRSLNSSYAELQTKLVDAKRAVQEATRAYRENADEANRTNLQNARMEYKNLTDRMQEFRAASADTRKEIRELQNEMRKMDEGSPGASGGASSAAEALTGRAAAMSGLAKQLGGAVAGYAGYALNSALGSSEAGILSSALTGAAEGAATGLLAGPWGALAGGIVGAGAGLISGYTAKQQEEDDIFRSYRSGAVNAAEARVSDALSGGTATAAQREQDAIAFRALLGDGAASAVLLNSIKDLANVTPYVYDDLTGIARQLAIFDSTSGDIYGNLVTIGDAGSALGLSASSMEGLAQLLGKIGDSTQYDATFTRWAAPWVRCLFSPFGEETEPCPMGREVKGGGFPWRCGPLFSATSTQGRSLPCR